MADAFFTVLEKTLTLPTIMDRALSDARLGTASLGYQGLAEDTAKAAIKAVQLANEAAEDILDEFPMLNVVSTEVTSVASTATIALPEDLRFMDVIGLTINDDSGYQGREITYKSFDQSGVRDWPIDTGYTSQYPLYFTVTSGGSVLLYPTPNSAVDYILQTRGEAVAFDVDDLGEEAVTPTISSIPTKMLDLYGITLAIKFAENGIGAGGQEMISLQARQIMLNEKWHKRLVEPLAGKRNAAFNMSGYVNDTMDQATFRIEDHI